MPHGQENSGNSKKNDKSQVKMGVFEKSQEKIFKKHQSMSVQIYQISFIKISIDKKLIKNSLKSY